QNQEVRQQQVDAVAASMKSEADKMRDMAATQLALGIASGVITIAGGAVQAGMAGNALTKGLGSGDAMLANTQATGVGQAIGGGSGILNAISQFVGTQAQAEFKEMEADQEKMRAYGESVKSLDDGLKELIQKALEAQNAIQQTQNQARSRILG
ncbi:MAG: hypothetical protein LBU53_04720, partial [Zoogloeaceae bacterium]|nr:hypothetical protein [Zoogloeaceae bacterium]